MRLIDADELILHLNDYALQEAPFRGESADTYNAIENCIKAIEEQPTAYDIDKVVEELKKIQDKAEWLEELKTIKSDGFTDDLLNMGFTKGYSKAETDYHAQSEKDRQSSYDCGYGIGYKQAIDDLIAKCENAKLSESDEISLSDIHTGVNSGLSMAIRFAEQLKEGEENGK